MRRLLLSLTIILALVGLAELHVSRLRLLTDDLTHQVSQVDTLLIRGNWNAARKTAQDILDRWEKEAFYLHVALRHTEIDAIRTTLKEVLAYLDRREDTAECLAATARLANQLELLLEAELPTLKNLL